MTAEYRWHLTWVTWVCLCLACLSIGCGRGMTSKRPPIHPILDMDSQPKYKAQSSNQFFYDRKTLQPPVPGTVALGELRTDDVLATGKAPDGSFVTASPLQASPELLARGADRYDIYCTPCHRASGDGQGMLFKRGVPTANLHDERLRAMTDGELFHAITNGVGLMPSYAYPIPVEDRWAIVAHVRVLQNGTDSANQADGPK